MSSVTSLTLMSLALTAMLLAACTTDADHYTQRDPRGNYATSSQFNSLDRAEFKQAMQVGLTDFDGRLAKLEAEAHQLGPDALEEYEDDAEDLKAARDLLEARLARLDATLDQDDWEDLRDEIIDEYEDLREMLDDTYEEVLEEG